MARSRQPRQSRGVSTTKPPNHTSSGRNFDDEEMSDDDQSIPPTVEDRDNTNDNDSSATDQDDEEGQLKSNVWNYATKVSSEEAQCVRCKCMIKTVCGGTSTLRKHLVTKHNLTHLILQKSQRRETKQSAISRERKIRLDYLANLAIYEDGRTFTDFRKSGIRKFLAEAIPGNCFC
jgi:hypothetical protein